MTTAPSSPTASPLSGPSLDAGLPAMVVSVLRPIYWCVRRELWEHRSLSLTPVISAGLLVVAILLNASQLPELKPLIDRAAPLERWLAANIALALPVLLVSPAMWIVAAFYALDCLHAERRDRSILFWKSLPVSDITTVLSKLAIPLVVTPLFTFAAALVSQLTLVIAAAIALQASGYSGLAYLKQLEIVDLSTATVYVLAAGSLWYAPVYAWLMLVSAWSRRNTLLWALLMPLALSVLEGVAFRTTYLGSIIVDRIYGFVSAVFRISIPRSFDADDLSWINLHLVRSLLNPVGFVCDQRLWLGLLVAGAFVAATVWLRRHRDPI